MREYRFTRRRYGRQSYCWASVLHCGQWIDLGDPWPGVNWPARDLERAADFAIASSAAQSPEIVADSAPEFELRNDPPRHRRATFADNEAQRQRVLIDGLHCLPGQLDLF